MKKNKKVSIKTLYIEVGKKKQNVKITDYKIKNSKQKGYKELTFKVTFTNNWTPTNKEIHKMIQSGYFRTYNTTAGRFYITAMDYNTGMCLLDEKNNQGVTVKTGSWQYRNRKTYRDNDGCTFWMSEAELEMTITYPKNYKGLCIAVGGYGTYASTSNDKAYDNGEIPFGKSDYYKKNKSSVHVMRVTK